MANQSGTSRRRWARLLALGSLCAAASTCAPAARAQVEILGGEDTSLAASEDEWRLDGVIVRADARAGAFWIEPDVLILRDEDADLNGPSHARRVWVDGATQVWTPDGQARPFGFNALAATMRLAREVSVVGTRENTPAGPILHARLVVLPDLLPPNWKPEPFGRALRAARAPSRSGNSFSRPVGTPAKAPRRQKQAVAAPPRRTQAPRLSPPMRPAAPGAGASRIKGATSRAVPIPAPAPSRLAVKASPPPALARSTAPPTTSSATMRTGATAAATPRKPLQPAPNTSLKPRAAAALTPRVVRARPRLSRADGAQADATEAAREPAQPNAARHSEAAPLASRDSPPPVIASSLPSRAPSSPRVGADSLLQARSSPLAAAPRDIRRVAERHRLRHARPSASGAPAPSAWQMPASSPRAGRSGEATARLSQSPLANSLPEAFSAPERRVAQPPLLSSPSFGSSSRLATPSAPQTKTAPALLASGPQVLAGARDTSAAADAVQVLALGEQHAAQAREKFAALRALQDAVRWPHFNGGPGWDEALQSAARATPAASLTAPAHKMVALTFDDGPHPNTLRILDILDANGARGTFFVVGRNVERHQAILREIVRRGHDVGNHSAHHVQGVRLSSEQWGREVDECSRSIEAVLGASPRWFRAPGCRYTMEALGVLRSRGLVRVDSSNNSGDWHQSDPAQIVSRVLSRLAPGQVLLFHDPLPQTVRALPALLRELRARGYKCVTLSELAHASAQAEGFTPPIRPPGQGIILPAEALSPSQVLEGSALPADAPVLLQVRP